MAPVTIPYGTDAHETVAQILQHEMLVVSPIIGGHMHEVQVKEGKPQNAKDVLAETLKRCDFRNLEDDGEWLFRGTLTGPSVDANPLELLAPSFFVSQVRNPEGRWLEFNEMLDACDKVALDPDVAYVRVASTLMNLNRLRMLASQSVLPNGIPAAGILVRPENAPCLIVRFENESLTKGTENGTDTK